MKRKLLSILLTFCLAFSLLPTAALAEEATGCVGGKDCSHQAAIGDKHYDTLVEAVSAAKDDETITLLGDAELTETLNINKAITLDGASHKITGNPSTGKTSFITVKTDGNFTMKNVTILPTSNVEANAAIDLQVKGKVIVDSCVFGAADDTNQFMYNGLEFSQSEAYPMADGTTISNCTFYGGSFRHNFISFYRMAEGATININENKFLNANWDTTNAIRVSNYGSVSATINLLNDTYSDHGDDSGKDYAGLLFFQQVGHQDDFTQLTVNIENLDTTGAQSNQLFYVYSDITQQIISTDQPVVNGDSSIEKFFVAKVGDTYYKTLPEAIAAAKDGETVILLSDRKNFVTNTINANITIDLNGKTLSVGNNVSEMFKANGEVTIQNGTITSDMACAIVNAYNKLTLKNVKITGVTGNNGKNLVNVCSNAEVTIDKDTVLTASGSNGTAVFIGQDADAKYTLNVYGKVIQESKSFAISGNGSYEGTTTINIYDGAEVKSASVAIYHPQAGVINVYGGLVEGYCAIGIKSGTLNINGGTVRGTADDHVLDDSNSTSGTITYDGSAIVVDSRSTGYAGNVKINVTGGTVESRYSTAIREIGEQDKPDMTQLTKLNVTGGEVLGASQSLDNVPNDMLVRDISVSNVSVSGGAFNHKVQQDYCATGYEPTQNGNPYGVKIKANMVAEVLDAQGKTVGAYNTLAAAITAAKNGETVKLLKDVDENVTIPAGKTITLDLNGFTLVNNATAQNDTIADRKHTITNNGTLTIKDSVGGGIVDNVSHGCAAIKNNVGGTVTIENGTFCRTAEASTGADNSGGNSYYVIDNQGTMNINGGTFKFSDTKDGAYSSLIHNGWQDGTKNTGKTPAKMTITDGNFTQGTGGKITVKNDDYGELKIQGGTFTQPQEGYYCVLNWNVAEITGGTINGPVGCGGNGSLEGDKGKLTIGGTARIDGELQKNTSYGEPSISVTGGNFANSVKDYVVSDLTAELKRASGETPYSYYTDVAAAAAAAQPGDTVTDLSAQSETFTLTLKYNDGAAADTTYNVAGNTVVTLPAPKRSGYTFNGWYDGSKFYAAGASYTVSATVTLNASWSYISSGSSSYDPTYSVSTPSKTKNGTVTVSPKSASKGDTVTVTVKPDSGYVLETLTVTDKNGNELTLKDKGNGKYTFTMPAGKVEVKATFMEDNSMLNFFYDVPNNAYFYEAVKWAVKNGITTGVGNDLFAPEQPCTRAQIVTFLWRAAGSPEPKAASSFADVAAGSYYAKAVAWAVENGITTGTGDGKFSPDATCTRAQAVTFLARALNAKASGKAEFSDVPADSYFADAVAWAAANGVTEGIGGGLFGPDNDCTRGQIVTFLYRAYNK